MEFSIELLGVLLRWIIGTTCVIASLLTIHLWVKNKTRRISLLRILIQGVALLAIYYILSINFWPLWILIIILVSTLFLGRFFCGWICPYGLYMDLITILRKTMKIQYRTLPEKFNRFLNLFRYIIFAVILFIPFYVAPLHSQSYQLALFFAGPFKHLTLLIGPIEPLILPETGVLVFEGLNLSYPYLRDVIFYSGNFFAQEFALIFFALTLIGSFLFRRVWCRFCPLGLSFAIINKIKGFSWIPLLHLDKSEEKCTKCGICKRVCPPQVTQVYENKGGNVSTSICVHCFRCVEMCPYKDCLKVKVAGKTIINSRDWLKPSEVK